MANQLGMAEQHSIITLWKRGWSRRRIARTLGIHRETVSRYVRLASERIEEAHGPPISTETCAGSAIVALRLSARNTLWQKRLS